MYRFYCRRFLNLRGHHAGAYVLAIVEKLPDDAIESPWAREIRLELADCFRHVTFEFPLETAADRRNSLRKARLIADVAARFADALETEVDSLTQDRRGGRRRRGVDERD